MRTHGSRPVGLPTLTPNREQAAPPSRRQFLALGGAVLLGGVAVACGGDSDDQGSTEGDQGSTGTGGSSDTTGAIGGSSGTRDGFVVVQRFPSGQRLTPGDVRLALSLARTDGALLTDGPARLTGLLRNEQGATVATIDTPRRGAGLGVPYWSITATLTEPGLYDLLLDGAVGDPAPFFLYDAAEVSIPTVGSTLPRFDTPTTDDARGVDPVCTRLDGPCPFHDITLTDALGLGKPVVYLIGTPAHCATATCGPGLDFLMAAAQQYADMATFVHAEVYADPEATVVAPAVLDYTLDYEPVMWITDATGTVVRRIDIVWDAEELGEMLAESLA